MELEFEPKTSHSKPRGNQALTRVHAYGNSELSKLNKNVQCSISDWKNIENKAAFDNFNTNEYSLHNAMSRLENEF